ARARVVWARREAEGCRVGVQFLEHNDAFRARMVEKVCAIEQYRKQMAAAGRTITREAAAREGIERYGSSVHAICAAEGGLELLTAPGEPRPDSRKQSRERDR